MAANVNPSLGNGRVEAAKVVGGERLGLELTPGVEVMHTVKSVSDIL